MSYERTRSGPPFWMLAAALMLALLAWHLVVYKKQQQHRQLHDALTQLQLELEAYAVDNEGSYPTDLSEFIATRKLVLPSKPYGTGPLKVLQPTDPWEPGGIVYVAWGPALIESNSLEVDTYLLLGYGTRSQTIRPNQEKVLHGVAQHHLPINSAIDWEHVAVVLSAGEDYASH